MRTGPQRRAGRLRPSRVSTPVVLPPAASSFPILPAISQSVGPSAPTPVTNLGDWEVTWPLIPGPRRVRRARGPGSPGKVNPRVLTDDWGESHCLHVN